MDETKLPPKEGILGKSTLEIPWEGLCSLYAVPSGWVTVLSVTGNLIESGMLSCYFNLIVKTLSN